MRNRKHCQNNKFIVFEGIDGVGKTTLSRLLCRELKKRGLKAVRYEDLEDKNSGYNLLKPFIKKHASPTASLFFYLSSAIYKSEIIGRLLEDNWVVCDRYVFSTLAYHKIKGADMSLVLPLSKLPITRPDFLFIIELKEKMRQQRVKFRIGSNKADFRIKTSRSEIARMEQELEKFGGIIVDNSKDNPSLAMKKIIKKIFKTVS